MTNMLTKTQVRAAPVTGIGGAGCRTTWQKVRTGAVLALAGAWLLACFGSADVWAQGMTLDICPTDYGSFPENAPALTCGCSAAAAKTGTVWGTNPYYYQSGLCRAALHAGAIGADGGQVVVQPEKSTIFPAVLRNGVETRSTGPGMGFRVVVTREPAAPKPPAPTGAASPAAPPQTTGMTLDICPVDYGSFPEDAPPLICGCSAATVKTGTVWGANPYYYQSGLCRAAVHAGAIGAEGGEIVVQPRKSAFYPAVSRNGVEARSTGAGTGFSVSATAAGGRPGSPVFDAASSAGLTLDICPVDYGSFPEDAPPLTCGCSAATVKTGTVWGANPYYYQSGLCRAAVHAGAIGAEGGQIVVQPRKSAFYPAVLRNGVEARSTGAGAGFSVTATAAGGRPGSPVFDAASSAGLTLDICPVDYGSFPEDAPPLTCGCSADTMKTGTVWGANPYYYQSGLCRAALHAGAIGAAGGKIEVKPEKAPFFPAVSRNGVEARSANEGTGFRVTAVPGSAPVAAAPRPSVDQTGKPIQAPIAATLRETGRVQLYINFATDQARPLPSSEPVLQELLATLQGDRALRVALIGHTDNQGSAPYNLDLSQRRAAAVFLWLIQHGVDSGRLRSDGRGLMEPIADNTTESGRALNRRVEVKASN